MRADDRIRVLHIIEAAQTAKLLFFVRPKIALLGEKLSQQIGQFIQICLACRLDDDVLTHHTIYLKNCSRWQSANERSTRLRPDYGAAGNLQFFRALTKRRSFLV